MTLSLASWFPAAKELELGRKRRVPHECGQGTVMIVSRDEKGYRASCFRCNDTGWAPPEPEPLAVRLARLAKANAADNDAIRDATLPTPTLPWSEWPPLARLWLLKAGLSGADAGKLGAYYHPPSDRVVLPVLDPFTGHPEFWQARAVDGRVPKYLAPNIDRARVIPRYGSGSTVTLTEDILSAYKVGLLGEGWSLMGTTIKDHCLSLLVQRGCKVNVWLDPDGPGKKGAKSTLAALRAAGLECRNILTTKDPKLMHREQIKEIIYGYSNRHNGNG